jgi:hypothetical protein
MLASPGRAARVNRGGSWNNDNASNLRAANRNRNAPTNRNDNLGFRCARTARPDRRMTTALRPAPRRHRRPGPRRAQLARPAMTASPRRVSR